MAEKYGTIPKKFTPEWWEYFWMYNKTRVMFIALFILVISVTAYQILTSPEYDITLTYAVNRAFSDDMCDKITETLSPMCDDVDKNGEKSLNLTQINLNGGDASYNAQMGQKLFLSVSEQDVYIYILDPETANHLIASAKESNFVPVSEWYTGNLENKGTYDKDGISFGIELTDCAVFEKMTKNTAADLSGNYLFVRYYPRKDQIEDQLPGYNAAKKLAKKLVTG